MISFVADEHIPYATIRLLREAGHTVISISEQYPSISDNDILRLANAEGLVIITNDSDFGDLIYRDKIEFEAGIIYFRLEHFRPNEMAEMILRDISENQRDFRQRFTIISRTKIRQREL